MGGRYPGRVAGRIQVPPATAASTAAPTRPSNGTALRPVPPPPNGASDFGFGGFHAREIRARLLERALHVLDFVTAQCRFDEQPDARRGHRAMQEAIDDARGDLRGDARLFFRRADDDKHEVGPCLAQAFRHHREIALDEHAVEQARRYAAAVQVRSELRF